MTWFTNYFWDKTLKNKSLFCEEVSLLNSVTDNIYFRVHIIWKINNTVWKNDYWTVIAILEPFLKLLTAKECFCLLFLNVSWQLSFQMKTEHFLVLWVTTIISFVVILHLFRLRKICLFLKCININLMTTFFIILKNVSWFMYEWCACSNYSLEY